MITQRLFHLFSAGLSLTLLGLGVALISTPAYADGPVNLTPYAAWLADNSNSTNSVAWGDMDGDGDLDLAIGNYGQPNKVYLNVENTLQTKAIWTSAYSDYTYSVAWGDMDSDGDLDLAVGSNAGQDKVYLNMGGMLQTTATWFSSDSDCTNNVAWGDVDGDGDLDLATGNLGSPDRIYLNVGGMLQTTAVWTSGDSDYTNSVAWGDVDGDGDLDLAMGNVDAPNKVYLNIEGTLQITPTWTAAITESTRSIAWGDMDSDGDLDLAVGNWGSPDKIYLNVGGILQTTAVWTSGDSDYTNSVVAWGDVDGDGDLDLAMGNYSRPNAVYLNVGNTLQTMPTWTAGEQDFTNSIAWGDVDGDGDLDLASGNYNTPNKVYLNVGGVLQVTATWLPSGANPTYSVAWGDVDGDGDLDLATGNKPTWDGSQYIGGQNKIYLNVDGVLQAATVWSSSDSDSTSSVAWGDVDGDGDLDLAAGNDGLDKVYLNVGGMLQTSAAWTSADIDDTRSVAWGDVDGDGDLDLAAGNDGLDKVYLNVGGMLQTSAAWTSADIDDTRSVAWGDVDGDGDLDLATGNWESPAKVYLNERGMLQTTPAWASSDSNGTNSVAWGDVDGDGDLDLAVGNSYDPNKVYLNVDGVLQTSATWISGDSSNTWSVAWGDMDNDGDLDLATGNFVGSDKVYRNGVGMLQTTADNPLILQSYGTTNVAWGDVDCDGDLDLAASEIGSNRLHRNTRDARLLPGSAPTIHITQPGPNANLYSSPKIWSGVIPITYTLSDPQGDPVKTIRAWYSLDGGGRWYTATTRHLYHIADASGANLSTTSFVTRTARNTTPISIPDLSAITSALTLTPTDMIADIDVTLNLTHTNDSNMVITLTAPFSRAVRLVNQRGGSGDNFTNTVFDDEAATSILSGTAPFAGRFRPEQTLAHFDGYSPQGDWMLSIADVTGGDTGRLLSWGITATLNSGKVYTYAWDVAGSGFFGQSDNVVFRIQEIPAVVTGTRNATPGPYLYGAYASQTFPFRVRGTQVRVMSGTTSISQALVYRLPAGQTDGGGLIADNAGNPFRTNGLGYLQGRGEIKLGDRLLALAPAPLPLTYTQRYSDTLHLYYTNGTPTATGLDAYTVTTPGVQTITVSSAHPLLLFDLNVSLEWDAHNDPIYLQQLEFDLKKASEYLYDFTDGQVALGQVTVYQNAEAWAYADVVVQSTNRLRPFAVQGGIVLTPTLDPNHSDIVYDTGQVRMGATWNRYGNADQTLGVDWPLALAHELSHYLLFQDDTYLGLNGDGLLIPVNTCTGSVMGDMYDPSGVNTEFVDTGAWLTPPPKCANTLAHKTLGRSEWATLKVWYPWLKPPVSLNPGPSLMPFDFTTIIIVEPLTPTNTLADPTFYLDYKEGEVSSSEARAFLLQDDSYVFDLGSPVGGQNRLLARGARPGDLLCVFDGPRPQYGCEVIENGDERLNLEKDETWTPLVQFSPVTSRTFNLQVGELPGGLSLKGRLYPEYGAGSQVIPLAEHSGVYSGTFVLTYSTTVGHVQVWVDETATENNPRRETIVGYTVGGNPGNWLANRGGGPANRGGGPANRGGGPAIRGGNAPLVSPDGQMIFFTANPDVFQEGDLYAIQSITTLPSLPVSKKAIGPAYQLVTSPQVTGILTGSISFQYQGVDALTEGVDENTLTIHFWDGQRWQALATNRDAYYNLASTASQGPGVYALLANVTAPVISTVTPSTATNDVTTTLTISGDYFLSPVVVTLVGPTAIYTLPVTAVSPYAVTAVVTRGLLAREYQVWVVNGDGGMSPTPGVFALYTPAQACFYDFFESGTSKWQVSGDWGIVILPDGQRAMTDSPAGAYKNAGDYGSEVVTYTTTITSQAFNLAACSSPTLTFRHDYVIAKVGSSEDIGRVEISTNNGLSWTTLVTYTGGGIFGLGAQDVGSPEWGNATWQPVEIGLSGYAGMARLRFSLEVNDDAASSKGWVIDDVMVRGEVPPFTRGGVFLPIILKEP